MPEAWLPSASISVIKERSILLDRIRNFFRQQNVLEVETPLLCQYAPTSLHIDPIAVDLNSHFYNYNKSDNTSNNKLRFLQTSPEYSMKRLLAAGSGDIFQLCKAFRDAEIGNLHNPEFTILEWYRVGFNHYQLMNDVDNLLKNIFSDSNNNYTSYKISYREIFSKYLKLDPVLSSIDDLKKLAVNKIELSDYFKNFLPTASKQDVQELLFSNCIEPEITKNHQIWFVYNYPIEQAALAKIAIDQDGVQIAERFEVYINGIELANGYHELLDANLQQERFIDDQKMRQKLGKSNLEIDPYLIAALNYGMPNCSGVALGVDRLLMIKTQAKSIKEVMCFPWEIA